MTKGIAPRVRRPETDAGPACWAVAGAIQMNRSLFAYAAEKTGKISRGGGSVEEQLEKRLERVISVLERMRLDEYVEYVSNRKRMVRQNILYGMLRGLGFTIGFSVLGALVLVLLSKLVVENIPLIGGFLAEVIDAIQNSR